MKDILIACAIALLASMAAAGAQSLKGSEGDKRYPARFPNAKDPCAVAYRKYVAHGGHAAYAQSASAWGAEAFFCAIGAGRTQAAAEAAAAANCQSLFKRYKMKTIGRCQIYASK